jgi:nitrate reductase alpha subunit
VQSDTVGLGYDFNFNTSISLQINYLVPIHKWGIFAFIWMNLIHIICVERVGTTVTCTIVCLRGKMVDF